MLALVALIALLARGCAEDDGGSGGPAGGERELRGRVVDVVDGDTIEVSLGGEIEDVRYIGIDTPESVAPGQPVECFGKAASRANERLVGGEVVRLVLDRERRDRYGRLLAYVHLEDMFVNAELVERGFATTLEIEPNTARATRLARLEIEAGREGRGLWGACPQ